MRSSPVSPIACCAAVIWELVLAAGTIACIVGMLVLPKLKTQPPPMALSLMTYVTAQVMSAVVNASASKLFALVDGWLLYVSFGLASACSRAPSLRSPTAAARPRRSLVPATPSRPPLRCR